MKRSQKNWLQYLSFLLSFRSAIMNRIARLLTWHGWVAVGLGLLTLIFLVTSFAVIWGNLFQDSPPNLSNRRGVDGSYNLATYLMQVSYTIATVLIAWLAVFGHQIADEFHKPIIELSYSHDSAELYRSEGHETWFLFLTVRNRGRTPAKDAVVKCLSIVPPPLQTITSSSDQPVSPIPLKWAYWDAYNDIYGVTDGPRRSLHRTIYSHDVCGIFSIARSKSEGCAPQFSLALFIKPNNEVVTFKANVEYTVTCRVEAENYRFDKSWKFRTRWHGNFPTDRDQLIKSVQIECIND